MEVLVLGYCHNDQDVLQQADDTQSHKHFRGYEELLVAASWGVALCIGLAGTPMQSIAVIPEMQRLECPTVLGEIHLMETPFQLPAFKTPVLFAFLWNPPLPFQFGKRRKISQHQGRQQFRTLWLLSQNKVSNSQMLVNALTDAVSDHHHIHLGDLCHRVPTVCKFVWDFPLRSVLV